MTSNTTVFPLNASDAFKLNLMNLPYFHNKLKLAYTREILEEDGDFLIQDYDDETLLLSVRVGSNVLEFSILICILDDNDRIGFEFCGEQFSNLSEIVSEFCANYFRTNENEKIRLCRPVYRNKYIGRFGYGKTMRFQKDEFTTVNSFIRSLRPCFTSLRDVQSELEKLIELKCRHLVAVQDFQIYDMGRDVPPVVLVRYDAYERNLFEYLKKLKQPMSNSKYLLWCYQAGKALEYLASFGYFHRRLSPRACLLDFHDNLKVSDYWTDKDVEDAPLFQKLVSDDHEVKGMHRDGWRFLPPETIAGNLFTASSHIWTYALLIWQIFTHCKFSNRIHYASLADFLAAKLEDDPFYMPGSISKTDANKGHPERRKRMLAFYKACDNLPLSAKALNDIVPKCLRKNPNERPCWSELFSVVDSEYRISKLSFSLSKIL